MRRRLLASTFAIALLCVAVLGVPLALLARNQVWNSARDRLHEQAASIATAVEDRLDAHQPVDLAHYLRVLPGRHLEVTTATGRQLSAGPDIAGAVLSGTQSEGGSVVTVQVSQDPTAARARNVTLVVVGLAVLAAVLSAELALWQARRIARPIGELAARADALGRGQFDGRPLGSGIPEIDRVSAVLERSARQIGTLLDLQREFASDTAHQLRTPLTSIGLHLEEIGRVGPAPVAAEAADALAQVERLDAVITALLARARGDVVEPAPEDLADLTRTAVPPWQRVLTRAGRALTLDVPADPVPIRVRRDHVVAVIGSLLDNAIQHGDGTVTVTVSREGGHARLTVRDEGPGVTADLVPTMFERRVTGGRGTGIGLALARSLAAAEDGTLELVAETPATFVLTLPCADVSAAATAGAH